MNVAQQLTKTDEWHAARREGIGGSDAGRVMAGDWLALWEEKTGRREPDDLSDVLAVQMGTWTEPLNRYWFERQTGKVVGVATEPFIHPDHPFMRANLDGIVSTRELFEAKHVNAFTDMDATVQRHYWQCQHAMAVCGADTIWLSVFFGNAKWEAVPIDRDEGAIADMIQRERDFWWHVELDLEPNSPGAVATPAVAHDDMRTVDMTGNNLWSDAASTWLGTRDAAQDFKAADKALKDATDDDVRHAYGHGVQVKRAKNGALRVTEEK